MTGLELTDHFFQVPLNHFSDTDSDSGGETIEVFAREVGRCRLTR